MKIPFQSAAFSMSAGEPNQLPAPAGVEIAVSGRSNVGKSSLINRVSARKNLARVSASPGKTTTINFFRLSDSWWLVDLPGYGYAKRSHADKIRWAKLMEHYFHSLRPIGLVLQLLDIRHEPSADDLDMLRFLRESNQPFLCVLTKADKLKPTEKEKQLRFFSELLQEYHPAEIIPFTCMGEVSSEMLRNTVSKYFEEKTISD